MKKCNYARTIRFDEKSFKKAEKILAGQNIGIAEGIRLFIDGVISCNGLPFTVVYGKDGKEVKK